MQLITVNNHSHYSERIQTYQESYRYNNAKLFLEIELYSALALVVGKCSRPTFPNSAYTFQIYHFFYRTILYN